MMKLKMYPMNAKAIRKPTIQGDGGGDQALSELIEMFQKRHLPAGAVGVADLIQLRAVVFGFLG